MLFNWKWFLPGLLTTDVKKGGLDKIFRAWDNLKEKLGISNNQINNPIKSYLSEYDEKLKNIILI